MKIGYRVAIAAMGLVAAATHAQSAPEVAIEAGRIVGTVDDGVSAFRGIPFAAPPVGPLRWRSPQPVAAWSGVRPVTAYGHDCMQKPVANDAAPLGTPPSEDCLYLNVWRPAGNATKLPVLVWIYGGGFLNGGASPPTYSGATLAKQGIMFVSFNYRVGRFGWFVHPQLTRETPAGDTIGDFGFMDQVAALRWVRANIAAFGGDPANVTVIGESAGGASVHTLLTSPLAQGLFQRAVIQSGGDGRLLMSDIPTAEKAGLAFAASKGITAGDPQAITKLRALSAEDVTSGLSMAALFAPSSGPPTFSMPVLDGRVAIDATTAYADDRFNHVPVMLGATSADLFGPQGPMVAGARTVAQTFAAKGLPTYYYRFSYVASSARQQGVRGAPHASDIPFFFDTADVKYGDTTTPQDRQAAKLASSYLVNFVKRGDPNGPDVPAWQPYRADAPTMLDLDTNGTATPRTDP